MSVPEHHKLIAKHLRSMLGEPATVSMYRDNQNNNPVPIGAYGPPKTRLYSTIGICDRELPIPAGRFELAACGDLKWLPNALASSLYWLRDRKIEDWPVVCEDAVKHNVRSTYRHMAYLPSRYSFELPSGPPLRWLLGVPIRDSELLLGTSDLHARASTLFPAWMLSETPN